MEACSVRKGGMRRFTLAAAVAVGMLAGGSGANQLFFCEIQS